MDADLARKIAHDERLAWEQEQRDRLTAVTHGATFDPDVYISTGPDTAIRLRFATADHLRLWARWESRGSEQDATVHAVTRRLVRDLQPDETVGELLDRRWREEIKGVLDEMVADGTVFRRVREDGEAVYFRPDSDEEAG